MRCNDVSRPRCMSWLQFSKEAYTSSVGRRLEGSFSLEALALPSTTKSSSVSSSYSACAVITLSVSRCIWSSWPLGTARWWLHRMATCTGTHWPSRTLLERNLIKHYALLSCP